MDADIMIPHAADAPGAIPHFLALRLGEWLDRFDSAAARLRGPEPDDEAVHDVRVATRRLRGGLAAARPALRWNGRTRRLYRGLRDLRRRLGQARESEVALGLLNQLRAKADPSERPALASLALLVAVGDRSGGSRSDDANLHEEIASLVKRGRMLTARLESGRGLRRATTPAETRNAADPGAVAATAPHEPAPDAAALDLRRLALAAIDERYRAVMELPLEPLRRLDDAAQHRFRIEAKKLRYTMEFFAPLFSKKLEARVALLKAIQDLLGELHDLADLSRLAESARAHGGAAVVELSDGLVRLGTRLDERRRRQFEAFEPLYARLAHPGFAPRMAPPSDDDPPAPPEAAPPLTPAEPA